MNDKEFFENMDSITEDLWDVAATEPFDSEKWQGGVEKFYRECHNHYKRRLLVHKINWLIYTVLAILLTFIFWKICF